MNTGIDLTTASRDVLITIIAKLQATVLEQQRHGIMAQKLVYAGGPMAELPAMPELALVGGDPRC